MLCLPLILALAMISHSARAAEVPVVTAEFTPAFLPQDWVDSAVDFTADLSAYFGIPGIQEPIVQVNTDLGSFNMSLRPDAAPLHVENFLAYVDAGSYNRAIFHRNVANFVIQGGGYFVPQENLQYYIYLIDKIRNPVPLEYNLPNAYGTLAMARTNERDSATSEWYINTADNSSSLAPRADNPSTPANEFSDGYTVFGKVIGTGMNVVEALAALETRSISNSGFTHMPLINYNQTEGLKKENFVKMNSVRRVSIKPDDSGKPSIISYSIINSGNTSVAQPTIRNGRYLDLNFDPANRGKTILTIRATDTNGNYADLTVQVSSSLCTVTDVVFVNPYFYDLGGGFVFNASMEEYLYTAFCPFVYSFGNSNWWYVHEGSTDPNGFFMYDFGSNSWKFVISGYVFDL